MTTANAPPDDAALMEIGIEFTLAMMASASTDRIRPMDWWERARTALELSAESSNSPPEMVTRFAKRIHAQTLTASTAGRLSCLSSLDDPHTFAAFRRMVSRQSTYIVAFAQQRRAEERAEKENERAAKAPVEAQLATARDELRAVKADRDMWQARARSAMEDTRVLRAKLESSDAN